MNAYCVILRPFSWVEFTNSRTKRCYVRAGTADRAILSAAEDSPEWRPVGVEPSSMFAPFLQSDRSPLAADTWHAA
jgi:hypothetical protein